MALDAATLQTLTRGSPEEAWRTIVSAALEIASKPLAPGSAPGEVTRRDREIHRVARRKQMGRPKIGKGTQAVSITIELGLLKKADAVAKRRKVNRSQLITQALEREIERSSKSAGPRPGLRRPATVGRL